MANIVLTHPKHGAKVAISEQEALNDIANGWSRYSDPVVEVPVESVEQAEPVCSLKHNSRPRKEDSPAILMQTSED